MAVVAVTLMIKMISPDSDFTIDTAEPKSMQNAMSEILDVNIKKAVTDYSWHDYHTNLVGVERKAVGDFINCISDNSLPDQLRRLVKDVDIPFLLAEGPWDTDPNGFILTPQKKYRGGKVINGHRKSWCKEAHYWNTLYGLQREFGIQLMFSKSPRHTPFVMYGMYLTDQRVSNIGLSVRKHDVFIANKGTLALASIVGPAHAKELIKEFGSLWAVMNASREDIMKVHGMGKANTDKLIEAVRG